MASAHKEWVLSYEEELASWLDQARIDDCSYLLVIRDLTDGVIFPLYCSKNQDVKHLKRCFISESKMKVVDEIRILPLDPRRG